MTLHALLVTNNFILSAYKKCTFDVGLDPHANHGGWLIKQKHKSQEWQHLREFFKEVTHDSQ